MDLSALYSTIKTSHVSMAIISILFFTARGGSHILRGKWHSQRWARVSPHILDALLFVSGIWLMIITSQFPVQQNWLTVKMALLLAYIICGMKCMKSGSTGQQKTFFVLAISFAVGIIAVATTRHL